MFRLRAIMIKLIFISLVGLALVSPIRAQGEEAIQLKFAPEVGDEYSPAALIEIKIGLTEDGETKEELYTAIGVGFNLRFMAVDADGMGTGVFTCNMLKMSIPDRFYGTIYYDSTDPFMYIPRETKVAAMLLGEEIALKTDANFNIVEYCDLEDVAERILQRWLSQSEHAPEQAAELSREDLVVMKEQINKVLADLNRNANPISYYPERPVKVGDSWITRTQKENNGLVMQLEIVSTLVERTKGIAVIKEEGSITLAGLEQIGDAAGSFKIETGKYYGTVRIREENGFPVAQDSKLKVVVNISDDGPAQMNLEVDFTIKGLGCEEVQ